MDPYICWALWKWTDQWALHFPAVLTELQLWGHLGGFPVTLFCLTATQLIFRHKNFLINLDLRSAWSQSLRVEPQTWFIKQSTVSVLSLFFCLTKPEILAGSIWKSADWSPKLHGLIDDGRNISGFVLLTKILSWFLRHSSKRKQMVVRNLFLTWVVLPIIAHSQTICFWGKGSGGAFSFSWGFSCCIFCVCFGFF